MRRDLITGSDFRGIQRGDVLAYTNGERRVVMSATATALEVRRPFWYERLAWAIRDRLERAAARLLARYRDARAWLEAKRAIRRARRSGAAIIARLNAQASADPAAGAEWDQLVGPPRR